MNTMSENKTHTKGQLAGWPITALSYSRPLQNSGVLLHAQQQNLAN